MNNLTDKLEEIRKAFDFIKMKVAQAPTGSNDRFFTDIDKWANHGLQEVDALSKHSDPEVSEEEIERIGNDLLGPVNDTPGVESARFWITKALRHANSYLKP